MFLFASLAGFFLLNKFFEPGRIQVGDIMSLVSMGLAGKATDLKLGPHVCDFNGERYFYLFPMFLQQICIEYELEVVVVTVIPHKMISFSSREGLLQNISNM